MPLLTADFGIHPWYLDELTPTLRAKAEHLLQTETMAVSALTTDVALRQYYLPMGLMVSNYLRGDLPSLVYLVELRAQSVVHPTLAMRATEIAYLLKNTYGEATGLTLHLDPEPGRFNIRRGEHDIVKKS
jgi:hypothetical protein